MTDLELSDVQGLVARGYGNLKAATYVLLQIDDATPARAWLRDVVADVTPASTRPTDTALNLAFTSSGIGKLGLPDSVVGQFSNEFTAGMTTPHRQRMFGDLEASAPERWRWGGPNTPSPDLLLLLFAQHVPTLEELYA